MATVVQENRPYRRILHSDASEKKLKELGFESVFSSNVSAATVRGKDLIIRFHNSSVYRYANQAVNYERLMGAASKGKWVWRFLRSPQVPYEKIGSLPLPEDIDVVDEEVMKPRIPIYNIRAIVPKDYMTTGALPQISISQIAMMGSSNDILGNLLVGLFVTSF
jgi:hypothetical protein